MVVETAIAVTEGFLLFSQIYPIFAKNRGQHAHANASVLLSELEKNAKARTTLVPNGWEQPEFNEKTLVGD